MSFVYTSHHLLLGNFVLYDKTVTTLSVKRNDNLFNIPKSISKQIVIKYTGMVNLHLYRVALHLPITTLYTMLYTIYYT